MIAVDKATKENGCLQVIRGSHQMGRINHVPIGDQHGADPSRVEESLELMDHVYCEMEPGDAVFFHCNTLHSSDQNRSDRPRWAMVCCYSQIGNNSKHDPLHPAPLQPIEVVEDAAIREAGERRFESDGAGNTFLNPKVHLGESANVE